MKHLYVSILALFAAALLPAHAQEFSATVDQSTAQVSFHARVNTEGPTGTPVHLVHIVQRRPRPGCDRTEVCGTVVQEGDTHNMRTSAGTTWQYNQMAGTTAAVGTYIAVTNSSITPAAADTTLAGEIVSNGFARTAATVANTSGVLSVPSAPTGAVTGSSGTNYYYCVAAGNQGIYTTPSTVSSVISAAASLNATNYITLTWSAISGAAAYQVYQNSASSCPSGTGSYLAGGVASCTLTTCTQIVNSNTLTSVTAASSNLTNFGQYTLSKTFTATGTQSVQAFGIFNAASTGTMVFEGILGNTYTLFLNDTLQFTETVGF